MDEKCLKFHNAAEVAPSPSGLRMYRFPRAVCDAMGMPGRLYGRYVAQTTTGCEIRFVTDADRVRLSLTSLDEDGYVEVFRGDYRYYQGYSYLFPVRRGQVTHLTLTRSEGFDGKDPSLLRRPGGFSHEVWRVLSDINCTLALVDFEAFGGNVRPPRADEEPEKTLLCYGTSISYGACASAQPVAWCQLLGRLLNVNLLNKGMGGSCLNEAGVADYFASDAVRFDAILLENSVNMGGMYEEFERRTSYLLERLSACKPETPVFLLTSFPNGSNVLPGAACPVVKGGRAEGNLRTDEILRALSRRYPQARLIEGGEMLDDLTGLTCDMIHLSDYGHIQAATRLAEALRGKF